MFKTIFLGLFAILATFCLLVNRGWSEGATDESATYAVTYRVSDLAVWRIDDKQEPRFDASVLAAHIKSSVGPKSWEYGHIASFPEKGSLLISQVRENHRKVAEVLAALRQTQKGRPSVADRESRD